MSRSVTAKRRGSRASEPDVPERFWSKVDKGPDFWLWTASTFRNGRPPPLVRQRMSGALFVAGAVVGLVGNALHPVGVENPDSITPRLCGTRG